MKVVTLMENTACREGFRCEHGLSLYLETGSHKILFDAGQSEAFAENAEKLGVDLSKVDFAVLSHGHYDHGGGLGKFMHIHPKAPVYVSRYAFEPHYSTNGYIGLDLSLQDHQRILPVAEETVVAEGITLCHLHTAPTDTAGLTVEEDGIRKPDDFRHEQYLMIHEHGKKILISGCSHKGILQIMEAFHPDILIGGFHFLKIESEEVLQTAARKLQEYDTVYYTGHCTGLTQYTCLKSIMGNQLHYLSAGKVLEI